MKAMILEQYRSPIVPRAVPTPEPGPREVVLRVEAAALCGSDLHAQAGAFARGSGRFADLSPPLVLGHQIAGRVEAVGSDVDELAIGDSCVVYVNLFCGRCHRCLEGRQNLCENIARRIGLEAPGGFAEYVLAPAQNVFRAPAMESAELAVLPDAVGTAYHAVVRRAEVMPGERVVVVGIGAIGLYVGMLSVLRGAHVVAVDPVDDDRVGWARRFGVDSVITAAAEPRMRDAILGQIDGPVDAVIDVVGSRATLALGSELLRPGGRLAVVGIAESSELPLRRLCERGIRVLGCLSSTPGDLLEVLDLAARGAVQPLVAQRFALDEANEAMATLADSAAVGRLVLLP